MSSATFWLQRLAMVLIALIGGLARAETYPLQISAEALPEAEDKHRFVLISLMPDAIDPDESARAATRLVRGLGRAGFPR